jgi:hypothetical protein
MVKKSNSILIHGKALALWTSIKRGRAVGQAIGAGLE